MGAVRKDPSQSAGRAEILTAALREFADHGFPGATTAGIARRAGVTQPLIHHHFGSKQGLWDAVVDGLFREFNDALSRAMREVEGADRRTRFAHLLRTMVLFHGKRPELARLIRTESSAGGAPFDALYERWIADLLELFRRELSAAVDDGTFRPVDPRFAYFFIIGSVTHPFAEPETARRSFGLDMRAPEAVAQYADFVVDVVLRGLLAEPEVHPSAPTRTRTPRRRRA